MRSGLLAGIKWSVCMLKSHRSLCVAFSRTGAGLCIYHLFVWSNWNFLHISQWITLPTQSCLALYSFCANLLHSLSIWLIISSLSPHSLHLLFCCVLSILFIIISSFFFFFFLLFLFFLFLFLSFYYYYYYYCYYYYYHFFFLLGDGVINEEEYVTFMKSFAYTDDDPANNFTNICQVREFWYCFVVYAYWWKKSVKIGTKESGLTSITWL